MKAPALTSGMKAASAAFVLGALIAHPALAQMGNTDVFETSCSLIMTIRVWLFRIVYVLGAIGLVMIAVSAFLGRFKFAHLIALGGGLFVVAAADMLIDFVSGGDTDCTT